MSRLFTRRGNVAGFTAEGKSVTGEYRAKVKAWRVWIGPISNLGECHTFATAADADAFAESQIAPVKTEELKWW